MDTDDDNDDSLEAEEEASVPSCGAYVMHFITLLWKLLFATVPPTGKLFYNFFKILFLSSPFQQVIHKLELYLFSCFSNAVVYVLRLWWRLVVLSGMHLLDRHINWDNHRLGW